MVKESGTSDQLEIFRLPQNGDISGATALAQSATFDGVTANDWYRLYMDVTINGTNLQVDGRVFGHSTASDPNSTLNSAPIQMITYSTTVPSLVGLKTTGEAGVCFDTTDVSSRGSIPNIRIDYGPSANNAASVNSWMEIP